ncbi:hypothetical protein PT974_09076 [Cladobotryum mycophilum]|uniref:Extracellular membrane protein CFEM domain-containing protein n=1 Tax=Cladobotryum mycophilum TaxID=491253 RepID=A0ABR0SF54_9HYPO
MQFSNLFVVALAALPIASACKCVHINYRSKQELSTTTYCCGKFGGNLKGDDCEAHSIRNKLKSYWNCCAEESGDKLISDCRGKWRANSADTAVDQQVQQETVQVNGS